MKILEKKPPESGYIEFKIDKPPVSLQGNSNKKSEFKSFVKEIVKQSGFLLSGDVKVQIKWYVHEQKRYETDTSADVDNIVKPLIDALCGSSGLMIDDNQVQSVTCYWVNCIDYEKEYLKVIIEFSPDEFVSKEHLVFIHIANSLCFPINENSSKDFQNSLLKSIAKRISERNEFLDKGVDYYHANCLMSVQRVFHKSRLFGFPIKELQNKLAELTRSA